MLRAVFFDVGNTLLHPYPSVSQVVREVLIAEGHVRELDAIDSLMPLVDAFYEDRYREDDTFWTDEGETSEVWVGMYSLLSRRLGIEDEAEHIARRVYDEFGRPDRWRVYADVRPALSRLDARGLRLGVISNWDRRLGGLIRGLDVGAEFATVVSSAEVGLHKPDPRIFELACERVGVEPHEAAHVGDHHYADVIGAEAVGMHAVLLLRHGQRSPTTRRWIRTLDQLDDVLERDEEGTWHYET